MASWLIKRLLHNRRRVILMERHGIFVLLVDMWHASHTSMTRLRFADGDGGDGMASMGSMRVARLILGSALEVLARVLRR
jgi:hypothetical protein